MVHPRWHQLFRTLLVFVVTGWACAVAVRITDSGTSAGAALLGLPAIRSAVLGLAVGIPWAPLAAWPGGRRSKAFLGAIAGTLAGALGVVVYFWLWPPSWNAGPVATLKMFYSAYGLRVGPLSTLGGLVAAWWSARVQCVAPSLAADG
jgi:hypothetical protein